MMNRKCLFLGLVFVSMGAFGQGPEYDRFEKRLLELEERVAKLEANNSDKAIARAAPKIGTGTYKKRENWRLLQMGMSPEQVKEILGDPVKVEAGLYTFWGYPDRLGPHVRFDPDMKVNGWEEP